MQLPKQTQDTELALVYFFFLNRTIKKKYIEIKQIVFSKSLLI